MSGLTFIIQATKEKGGENIQSATERRQRILEYISVHRHVYIRELANEFHISEKTAQRDVALLECSYPISSKRGKYSPGISAADGWYFQKCFLSHKQEFLLRKLLPALEQEDQSTMQSILDLFSIPK